MAPFWATPLLLLPGVGLLIMSTQARYGRLHDEVHRLIDHHAEAHLVRQLLLRGRLFRNALVALYSACAVFALGALLGGLAEQVTTMAELVAYPLTMVGTVLLIAASVMLVQEATLSFRVLEYHDREARQHLEVHRAGQTDVSDDARE